MSFLNFSEYYNKEFLKWSKYNYQQLINHKDDDRVIKIIKKRYQKYKWVIGDITVEQYTESIFDKLSNHDTETLLVYMKDPIKENFAERIQTQYMVDKLAGVKINRLSTTSKSINSNGNIISGCNTFCKSFDIEINGYNNYLGFMKYTNETGGAQDNQFMDVQNFLKYACKNIDDIYFVVILDGDYYQRKHKKGIFKGDNKLNYLKSLVSNQKIIIGTIDEVVNIITSLENARR